MRAQARKTNAGEDEESAFVSMTDMTVGFLFIVMILLAFFASQFKNTETVTKDVYEKLEQKYHDVLRDRDSLNLLAAARAARIRELESWLADREKSLAETTRERDQQKTLAEERAIVIAQLKAKIAELERNKIDPLEIYMSHVAQARRQILERMRDSLKVDFPELQVQLSEHSDALRFQGDGLFVQGSATFTPGKADVVKRIAQRLNEVLPCYSLGGSPEVYKGCNPNFAVVEAVQIEGHTDSTGPYPVNIALSAERATTTFGLMIETVPALRTYKNLEDQSVMSFAGYGPDRPVVPNDSAAGRATNRRIDLRFIMLTPQSGMQLEAIRQRFIGLGVVTP
jgi:flagellar motor protein MotB